jgi:hypothetical protein
MLGYKLLASVSRDRLQSMVNGLRQASPDTKVFVTVPKQAYQWA